MSQLTREHFDAGIAQILAVVGHNAVASAEDAGPDSIEEYVGGGFVRTRKINALLRRVRANNPALAAKLAPGGLAIQGCGRDDAENALIASMCNEAMFVLSAEESPANDVPTYLKRFRPLNDDQGALAGPNDTPLGGHFAGVDLQGAYGVILRLADALAKEMGAKGYGHDFGGAAALPG